MGLLFEHWFVDVFSFLITVLLLLFTALKWSYGYWQRKGLLTPPTSLIFGNARSVLIQQESFGDFSRKLYNYFRDRNQPHGGFYLFFMSTYFAVDLEIVKGIMQNDFHHFVDRGVYHNEDADPLSAHLFSLEGAKWKDLRAKLTPTFTSGKMKMMFDMVTKCGDQLIMEMDKSVARESIDIKDMLGRFTTDIIGNCAFGINCNSLKNPDNEFTAHLKLFFKDTVWDGIVGMFTFVLPNIMRRLGVKETNQTLSTFFMNAIKDLVDYREKNNVYRRDFMHLLLQLKNRGKLADDDKIFNTKEEDEPQQGSLTMNELAAQAFVFFLAGYETSSTTMTFCLYELALNEEIQTKLRKEVIEVLKRFDNKLSYEAISEMRYMDKVINETLRKYPPLPVLNRVCNKDYCVPGTDLVLEKGTKVFIPVLGLQHDPEYYPDPETFNPERFSEEEKQSRHPYAFIPFGEGPRICIGLRFGMMQMKVGLSVLLKNYKFSISPKTVSPLEFDPSSFVMAPKGGIWLDFVKV